MPSYWYGTFLIIKSALNIGAAIGAVVILQDYKMAGFWFFLAVADGWLGVMSL